jgi:hypothetical protein
MGTRATTWRMAQYIFLCEKEAKHSIPDARVLFFSHQMGASAYADVRHDSASRRDFNRQLT